MVDLAEEYTNLNSIKSEKIKIINDIYKIGIYLKSKKLISKIFFSVDIALLIAGFALGYRFGDELTIANIFSGIIITESLGNFMLYVLGVGDAYISLDDELNKMCKDDNPKKVIDDLNKRLDEINSLYPSLDDDIKVLKGKIENQNQNIIINNSTVYENVEDKTLVLTRNRRMNK